MLSTMREKTKLVMLILMVAFVGWMIFDVGMGATGGGQPSAQDIGSVNGTRIGYQQWLEAYRQTSEAARNENPGVNFTREEQQEWEKQAFDLLVDNALLNQEYRRRGIIVTPREIVEAVRRLPPPEVQNSPDFQTDGQFDPAKYERFLASNNAQAEQFRLAMEARYREELPRYKLLQAVTSDVYISDNKLWTLWRDAHESLTVRALVIRPATAVADRDIQVTDEDARRYYEAHREEFRRPARAIMSFVAVSKLPTTVDSILIAQRVSALRDSIVRGQVSFEDAARTLSTDSASAAQGGALGTFGRGRMVDAFERAAFALPVGRISDPVYTSFGVHLIKVTRKTADSVAASHILLPHGRFGARLDTLEARADSLDRLAGEQTDGRLLDSTARLMDLSIERGLPMYQGVPYVLGRYRIPDVGVWAFTDGRVGETSPVIETSGAFYVFRLDSLTPAGIPPLSEVMDQARAAAAAAARRTAAERIARDAEQRLAGGMSLEQAAQALGLQVQSIGPFTRTASVPLLGTASAAIGSAFRLRIGERSGLMQTDEAFFFLQAERRSQADSSAWRAQLDAQRAQMVQLARRARAQQYVEGLRRAARIKDRRDQVLNQGRDQAQ